MLLLGVDMWWYEEGVQNLHGGGKKRTGNPEDSTRKLRELINEYSKVAGYKINTQQSLAFLYTNNEKTEREIKERLPFTT